METEEEYLDNLLKSLANNEGSPDGTGEINESLPLNDNKLSEDNPIVLEELAEGTDVPDDAFGIGSTSENFDAEGLSDPDELFTDVIPDRTEEISLEDRMSYSDNISDLLDEGIVLEAEEYPSGDTLFNTAEVKGSPEEEQEDLRFMKLDFRTNTDSADDPEPESDLFALDETVLESDPFVVDETVLESDPFALDETVLESDSFALDETALGSDPFALDDSVLSDSSLVQEDASALLSDLNLVDHTELESVDTSEGLDLDHLLDDIENDEELSEIKGLLDKADNNELVDDDMMALLDSMSALSGNVDEEENREVLELLNEKDDIAASKVSQSKSKKQKKKHRRKSSEGSGQDSESEGFSLNAFDELVQEPPKKPGFFGKLFAALTDTDEEDLDILQSGDDIQSISDENQEILDVLDKEDKKAQAIKAKKEAKNKKGKKSKGKNASAEEDAKERGEEAEEDDKKKAKKEKKEKEKKKKEKPETTETKPEKKVSRKKILLVVVFCSTIMAAIVTSSSFVPDYFERVEARAAYMNNDYSMVYDLLYGKNLSDSDLVLYNQSYVVLQMERKLDSYWNYQNMNLPVEALHALLQGVARHEELVAEGLYGADARVNDFFQSILDLLDSNYGISQQDAEEILAYDSVLYTETVYNAALGTDALEVPDFEANL